MDWSRSVYNQGGLPAAPGVGDKAQRYISSFQYRLKILGAASLGCGGRRRGLLGRQSRIGVRDMRSYR